MTIRRDVFFRRQNKKIALRGKSPYPLKKRRGRMIPVLKLLRVHHWVKNGLIFLPLTFGGGLTDGALFLTTLAGALCFCCLASAIYVMNDLADVESDRLHQVKRFRPLAAQTVSVKTAKTLLILTLSLTVCGTVLLQNGAAAVLSAAYFLCNIAYSRGAKRIPILDIVLLVSGFLIRLFFGAALTDEEVSPWLYMTVMTMACYLALGKRRNDLLAGENNGVSKFYTPVFLDKFMTVCLTLTIAFYALWAMSPSVLHSSSVIWTVPLVIVICMKYGLNIETQKYADPVDVLLNDKVLCGLVALYGLIMTGLLYWR